MGVWQTPSRRSQVSDSIATPEPGEVCELCGSDGLLAYTLDDERRMLLVCESCAVKVATADSTVDAVRHVAAGFLGFAS